MRKTPTVAWLCVLTICGGSAYAIDACDKTETITACFNKFVPALPAGTGVDVSATAVQKAADAQKKVAVANTGVSTLPSPASSSMLDFLSLLSASLQTANFSQDGQSLTFDGNVPFGTDQVKFQAVLAKPRISSELEKQLGTNADAIKSLNDAFKIGDDVTASATYNPVSTRFGRSIAPHRPLFESMLIAAINKAAPDRAATLKQFRAVLRMAPVDIDPDKTTLEQAFPDENQRARVMAEIINGFAAERAMNKAFVNLGTQFAALLNNQPQRYVSILYHDRKSTTGADEWAGKLTWEFGKHNLDDFYDNEGRGCDGVTTADQRAVDCLTALQAYATKNRVAETASVDRFKLSAEYHAAASVNVALPQYSVTSSTPGTHSLVYQATWGRSLDPTLGAHEARIDASASYENVSKDPTKKDRWVGSVTYTVKLNDNVSIPLSLIYANHAQYLSDVDRKLNAHFGLVYKLPGK